jgi:quercetin dioxygenase-like cupin family protein
MNPRHISFETIPWQSSAPGARDKVIVAGTRQIRIVEFTDEFVEPDWCRRGHIGYVLEGCLEIEFADRTYVYQAGEAFIIESGDQDRHKARSLGPCVRLLLVEEAP